MDTTTLPAPVRTVTDAVMAAALAVQAQDRSALDDAAAQLAAADPELVKLLLGGTARTALERAHPQGLDAEDARDVLERVVRTALTWLPDVDVAALILVLTGALGMQNPDEEDPVAPAVIAVHAMLLLAELGNTPDQVQRDLAGAVSELHRHQTVELP
jgi:hypothetical protein